MPSDAAWACPRVVNADEQIVTPTRPRFAISTLSWILHDVHDPQSPEPVMTMSQRAASSATMSAGAGTEADDFLRLTMPATP